MKVPKRTASTGEDWQKKGGWILLYKTLTFLLFFGILKRNGSLLNRNRSISFYSINVNERLVSYINFIRSIFWSQYTWTWDWSLSFSLLFCKGLCEINHMILQSFAHFQVKFCKISLSSENWLECWISISNRQTSWTNSQDGPARQTSWTDQLGEPVGRTSSKFLKPWPVCIFEDWRFSLYIVAAFESDKDPIYIFSSFFL